MLKTQFLVHSGDKSSYMWDYWYYWYKKYWNCENIIDTVFLSENITKEYDGVLFRHTGDVPWSDGLINYLESIPNVKWIIYQHEDYFLNEKTDCQKAISLINCCEEHDIQLLKCCGDWAGYIDDNTPKIDTGLIIDGLDEPLWLYNNDSQYLISHQTSIWNREFLLTTLRRNWTPWDHELQGTPALKKRNIPLHAYRGHPPFPYNETIQGAEVRPGCQKFFEVNLEE